MRLSRGWTCAAAAAALGLAAAGAPAAAPTTEPTPQQLLEQIKQLQAKVDQLQERPVYNQKDVDETVERVLNDANQRSKMLDVDGGVTAGHENRRFFIQSADGDFTFKPWIHMQIRYSTAWRTENNDKTTREDTQSGFELRRARFGFDGNLFGKDLIYFINWASNREITTIKDGSGTTDNIAVGGVPILEEAWIKYHIPGSAFFIKLGQAHDPLDHENIVGSKYRAPEASLQGDVFGNTDTFTQLASLIFDNKGPVRVEAAFTDGIRSANTNFEDYPNLGIIYDGGAAARAEWKLMGDWKDYDQLTAYGNKKDLLVLGSGVDDSWGGHFYSISHTVDLQYGSPSGLFAYLCYFGRYTNHNPGIPSGSTTSTSLTAGSPDAGTDTYESSFDAELAYLVGGANGKLEPFAKYEYMHLHGTPAHSNNNVTDISLGANYYFYGHNLKFTGMVSYLPNGIPVNDDSQDILISNDHPEWGLLLQLQLLL